MEGLTQVARRGNVTEYMPIYSPQTPLMSHPLGTGNESPFGNFDALYGTRGLDEVLLEQSNIPTEYEVVKQKRPWLGTIAASLAVGVMSLFNPSYAMAQCSDPMNDLPSPPTQITRVANRGSSSVVYKGAAGSSDSSIWYLPRADGFIERRDGQNASYETITGALPGLTGAKLLPNGLILSGTSDLYIGHINSSNQWIEDQIIPIEGISGNVGDVAVAFHLASSANIPQLGYAIFAATDYGIYRITSLTGNNAVSVGIPVGAKSLQILEFNDYYCSRLIQFDKNFQKLELDGTSSGNPMAVDIQTYTSFPEGITAILGGWVLVENNQGSPTPARINFYNPLALLAGGSGINMQQYQLPVPAAIPILGDIDGDNDIDMIDVDLFIQVLLGLETNPTYVTRSDLNNDNNADGLDIQIMTNVLLGI